MDVGAGNTVALVAAEHSTGSAGARLRLVRQDPVHEHSWALRDTEYDGALTVCRFECECGGVSYRA